MNDKNEEGIIIKPEGIKCIPCKFRKNSYKRNKKKTVSSKGETTVEENVDSTTFKFGRGTTPDIQPRTFTLEEKLEELETKIEEIKTKHINDIDAGFRKAISVDERLIKLEKEIEELKHQRILNTMD